MSFRTSVSDLFNDRSNFNIIGRMRMWFVISGVAIVLSIIGLFGKGLNLGIEFEGGTAWQVKMAQGSPSVSKVRDLLASHGVRDSRITVVGGDTIRAQTKLGDDAQAKAKKQEVSRALADYAGIKAADVNFQDVGPTFGAQITHKAIRALVFFLLFVTLYLALRFEFRMAVASLVALAHDMLITVGVYALSGFEVTPATVIAILTILGYSLYDTVVVFDKVRENAGTLGTTGKRTYSDVVNLSLNQTLMRSLNTSFMTLIPVIALLVVGSGLLGALGIRDFSLALLVGLLSGTYSSIFVAAPVLAILKEREPRYRAMRQRIEARQGTTATAGRVPAVVGAGVESGMGVGVAEGNGFEAERRPGPGDLQPRPRKQRRRKRKR